ncbi:type II toxin-antitoxin system PemK/MazF family toxin [Glycomyces sp. YM15]|uniref:type II toxin-antitoxin system PemK/MazF family toxin n=1 Tax=Glycomyces sp. YM15 TaxID=2800446 RepID=UPI00196639E3|nr:type II toxin-antitoxin system PemK/MazF family toxin [Glycomyces sp. YM15]
MGGKNENPRKGEVRLHQPTGQPICVVSADGHNFAPRTGMIMVAPIHATAGPAPVTVPLTQSDPVAGFVHVDGMDQVEVDELGEPIGMLVGASVERVERAITIFFDLPF